MLRRSRLSAVLAAPSARAAARNNLLVQKSHQCPATVHLSSSPSIIIIPRTMSFLRQNSATSADTTSTVTPEKVVESSSSSPLGPSVSEVTDGFLVFFDEHWWYAIFIGFVSLSFGIVLINLNERRAAKQNLLDDSLEPLVISLTDESHDKNIIKKDSPIVNFETSKELDGIVFHAHGDVVVPEQDFIKDTDTNLIFPNCIRIKRKVEMYQWKESYERKTDKDGNRVRVYSYKPQWIDHHSSIFNKETDKKNPPFPFRSTTKNASNAFLMVEKRQRKTKGDTKEIKQQSADENQKQVQEKPQSSRMSALSSLSTFVSKSWNGAAHYDVEVERASSQLRLRISEDFINRFSDFFTLLELPSTDNNAKLKTKFNLEQKLVECDDDKTCQEMVLYTIGADPDFPEIGDVRVRYEAVTVGKYTVLGIYKHRSLVKFLGMTQELPCGISPVKGKLKQTLVSQGEMVVPEEANYVLKRTEKYHKQKELSFSQWFLDGVESFLFHSVPLEFAYVHRGEQEKKSALEHYREYQGKLTKWMLYTGICCTSLGTGLLCYAGVPWMSESAFYRGTLLGLLISYKTQDGAQKKLLERFKSEGGDDGSDGNMIDGDEERVLPKERVDTSELKARGKGVVEL